MPLDAESYFTSACSTSERTGYVPFNVKLTCQTHAGQDGCMATGRVDLSAQSPHPLYGTAYRYMCDRELWEGTVEIQDAEVDLSGILFDALPAHSQQSFKQLQVRVESIHFDPSTFVLDWRVVLNWKLGPTAMVDLFTAEVFGEIVWTTNQDSRLLRTSGTCAGSAESCTASSTKLTWSPGWIYGGTALSGIDIDSQSPSSLGVLPTEISAELFEVVGSTGAKVAPVCTLRDGNTPPPGISCAYSALTIIGKPSEVFRAWVGPFGGSSQPPQMQGFSTQFYKRAATRCGLRSFSATSRGTAGTTSAIWLGAKSVDCGWSPGDVYNGVGLHGFEAVGGFQASPWVDFSLDATRLP